MTSFSRRGAHFAAAIFFLGIFSQHSLAEDSAAAVLVARPWMIPARNVEMKEFPYLTQDSEAAELLSRLDAAGMTTHARTFPYFIRIDPKKFDLPPETLPWCPGNCLLLKMLQSEGNGERLRKDYE